MMSRQKIVCLSIWLVAVFFLWSLSSSGSSSSASYRSQSSDMIDLTPSAATRVSSVPTQPSTSKHSNANNSGNDETNTLVHSDSVTQNALAPLKVEEMRTPKKRATTEPTLVVMDEVEGQQQQHGFVKAYFSDSEWNAVLYREEFHPLLPLVTTLPPVSSPKKMKSSDNTNFGKSGTKTTTTTTSSSILLPKRQGDTSPVRIECPPPTTLDLAIDSDAERTDQKPQWVQKKYEKYASKCEQTQGVMWGQLSLQSLHRITNAVTDLLLDMTTRKRQKQKSSFATTTTSTTTTSTDDALQKNQIMSSAEDRSLTVFDWASGCGAGTLALLHRTRSKQWQFQHTVIIGIDVTEAAVAYAKKHMLGESSSVLYCHGDGTELSWLPMSPSGRFDLVTSFGGLLHLPPSKMCNTVWQLLHVLREGGFMWSGYIDDIDTANALVRCTTVTSTMNETNKSGEEGVGVKVTMLKERVWFRGLGMPKANRRRNPVSIVWEKIGW